MIAIHNHMRSLVEKEYRNISLYRLIRSNQTLMSNKEINAILMTQQYKVSQLTSISKRINYPIEQFKYSEIKVEKELDLIKELYYVELDLLKDYEALYRYLSKKEIEEEENINYFRQLLKIQKLHIHKIKRLMEMNKNNFNDQRTIELKEFTQMFKTNWEKHKVNCRELIPVKHTKDLRKELSDLTFIKSSDASQLFNDRELLIVISMKNQQKAYPVQMLIFNEIVNDELSGIHLAVSHCPLSGNSHVFKRVLNNEKELTFNSTGLIRNENIVLYDQQTESLWQQGTGQAIVGDYVNNQLTMIPSRVMNYKTYKNKYPDGDILIKAT